MIKRLLTLLTISILFACGHTTLNTPKQSIFLFKDKEGIYIFDPLTSQERIIFKSDTEQIFLNKPCQITNGTLLFGIKGKSIRLDKNNYSKGFKYTENYISLNLKSGYHWISKKTLYEVNNDTLLKKTTAYFNEKGKIMYRIDTSMVLFSYSNSYNGRNFNSCDPIYFSKSTVKDKSVFSQNGDGNIYLIDKTDTSLLAKFNGYYEMKFGSGYFLPQIDPTGQFVVAMYRPNPTTSNYKTELRKIDIKTKNVIKIKDGEFNDPSFSNDGKFLLFNRNQTQAAHDTWTNEIYLLDLENLVERKIGSGSAASWQ